MLKQIRDLQEQLRGINSQLSSIPDDTDHIEQRWQWQQQAQAIQAEIAALQAQLPLAQADNKVTVVEAAPPEGDSPPASACSSAGKAPATALARAGTLVSTSASLMLVTAYRQQMLVRVVEVQRRRRAACTGFAARSGIRAHRLE